jgi:transcriptional regulator with XRE-family HTH domain
LTLCLEKRKILVKIRRHLRRPTLKALRMARADAGLTISELARRAGVSRDTISNAERGEHSLQATTLHKVARALGKTPSELLAEEERRAPKVVSRSPFEPSFEDELEEERHARLNEWLIEHGARRAILSDEEVLQNFERLGSGFDKAAIPNRFEQEARETIKEEARVLGDLQREWSGGGDLIPKLREPLDPERDRVGQVLERELARSREKSRLGREIRLLYRRYINALDLFSEALFLEGRAPDFEMAGRLEIVEARKAALQALRDEVA